MVNHNVADYNAMMRDLIQKAEFAFLFALVVGGLAAWPLYNWISG
jgi:hypothetical protein